MNAETLTKSELRDLKQGHAKMLSCVICGKSTFFGAMQLVSLGISNSKPTCSYECNVASKRVENEN